MTALPPYQPLSSLGRLELQRPINTSENSDFIANRDLPSKKKSITQRMAGLGAILLAFASIGVLLSPVMPKLLAARKLPVKLQQNLFIQKLQDKKEALKLFMRLGTLVGLLMAIYDFEVAANTRQPSKLLGKILSTALMVASIFFPLNLLIRGITFLGVGLWSAGERNDISNSLNLNQRREFDYGKLVRSLSLKGREHETKAEKKPKRQEMEKELAGFFRYVAQDLRYALSLKPWKAMFAADRKQWFSTTPQAYQTALSSQFAFLASLGAVLAFVTNRSQAPKTLKKVSNFQLMTQWAAFSAMFLQTLPLWMRAWQNRDQNDSRRMLVGIPSMVIGRALTFSKNFMFLSGLNGLGGALHTSGLASNSRKYRWLLDYLEQLYRKALSDPGLTAQKILVDLSQNNRLKLLEHDLGKTRVRFLVQTLNEAKIKQQTQNIPLASFLEPIVHSKLATNFSLQ